MKTTIVPAQITSVEDRITGNLSFKQLILLIIPVFVSTAVFIFLPPFTKYHTYKVFLSLLVASICLAMAIRIKSRLVVEWIGMLSRYNLRPRYYVFNKNCTNGRQIHVVVKGKLEQQEVPEAKSTSFKHMVFSTVEVINFEDKLNSPNPELYFLRSKKGGLRVHIKEN